MQQITLQQIRDLGPCYDPTKYLPENWTGTVIDILNVEDCPANDRLWVLLREDFIDAKTLRLFAVWCAREALNLIDNPDQRSIEACNVAERYANGEATKKDLAAAWDAAWAAERATAWAAASDAACSAAWDAASAAAWDAARAAERAAAWAAESGAQVNQLKKMLS